jgi:hypothetical protein
VVDMTGGWGRLFCRAVRARGHLSAEKVGSHIPVGVTLGVCNKIIISIC